MLNFNEEVASAPILEDDASLEGNSAAEHAIKEEDRKGIYNIIYVYFRHIKQVQRTYIGPYT